MCKIEATVRQSWGTGLVADLDVTFHEAVDGWTVEFEYDGDIVNIWNARVVSQDGNRFVVENVSYNKKLAAGASVEFGFVGKGTGTTVTPVVPEPEGGHHDHGHHDHPMDPVPPTDPAPGGTGGKYIDITAFGVHPGVSKHIHIDALEGGRTPITTEAHVIYNGLRAFLDLAPVELDTIGRWAFQHKLTNNPVPYGQDLKGVGLYYAMQGAKVAWLDDAAYNPQILADIQRTARLGDPADVLAMVKAHGHRGLADYLESEGLVDAFVNTLKMEPHYGGWKHGRAHGVLKFENEAGHRAPANTATAHDVNHLTVVNHAQTQPFYNDTFDWPQWAGRMVASDVVIDYFQSMLVLGDPFGDALPAGTGRETQTAFNATKTAWHVDHIDGLTLAASLFDNGGQGEAYNDTTSGKQPNSGANRPGTDVDVNNSNGAVGWIGNGEWLEYTIDVETAGIYDATLMLSSMIEGQARIDVFKPGAASAYETSGTILAPSTGSFNTFAARTGTGLELDAGEQVVRVSFPKALNKMDFKSLELTRSAFVVDDSDTLVFKASSYDNGGQGVGYKDAPGLQGGTNGGRAGSDVEVVASGAVGFIAHNEWMQYTLDVKEAGTYALELSMALGGPAKSKRQVKAEFFVEGLEVEEAIFDTPKTGGWRIFEDISQSVELDAGLTVMRLTFLGGHQNVLDISLTHDSLL